MRDKISFSLPSMGSVLSVLAGLSFYLLCMILPMVGPSGSRVDHSGRNRMTFLSVLLVTLLLSGSAAYLGFQRRRNEDIALPWASILLFIISMLMVVVLYMNGFEI